MKAKLLAAAIGVLFAIGATSVANAETAMRCSHQLPPTHTVAKAVDYWASEIKNLSEGEIDVQIFGAGSLMSARDNAAAVAKGNIECAFTVTVQWGGTIPLMNVMQRPFAFDSIDVIKAFPSSDAAKMLDGKLAEKNLKNVVWLYQTRDNIFTSNGDFLDTPEKYKGVKMRGLNPLVDTRITVLGATPVAMSGGEVYQALSTGVIDAALTGSDAAYARKYYEVQDHGYITDFAVVFFHGYVNPQWYERLSDKAKAALNEAGAKAAQWAIEQGEIAAAEAPEKLREMGMNVKTMTAEEAETFEALMQPAFDKAFFEATGDEGRKLVDLVNDLAAAK